MATLSQTLIDELWVVLTKPPTNFEGLSATPYLDTAGVVTVLAGRALFNTSDAGAFFDQNPELFVTTGTSAACAVHGLQRPPTANARPSGTALTREEWLQEYSWLQGRTVPSTTSATAQRECMRVRLGATDAQTEMAAKAEFERKLRKMFGELTNPNQTVMVRGSDNVVRPAATNPYARFDDWDRSAQLAVLDMLYNLGVWGTLNGRDAGLARAWPSFCAAVEARDWARAAQESQRKLGNNTTRNIWTKERFEEAAGRQSPLSNSSPSPKAMDLVPAQRQHKSKFAELLNVWQQREQNACSVEASRDALLKKRGLRSTPGTLPRVIP